MAQRQRTGLAVFAIVTIGACVPGFAQTDRRAAVVLARSSSTAVRSYDTAAGAPSLSALPVNLMVARLYQPTIEQLLRDSPTFRRQCARVAAAPQLRVMIESEPPQGLHRRAAVTHVSRYDAGRIVARVLVPTSTRTPELIAHELEHVLEQLDGVDLRAKARLKTTGVHACDSGDTTPAYETPRAVYAERRVALELEAASRR